jgi:hypothetical protein
MEALRTTIEGIAVEVASRRPGHQAQRIEEDAWGIIFEKLTRAGSAGYDPTAGEFEPWCRVVLENWAIDLTRRQARDPVDLARPGAYERVTPSEVEGLPDRDRGDAAAEQAYRLLDESLKDLRDWLDQAAGDWADRRVNFYAVFLLHLRQGLVNRLSRTWVAETGDLPTGEMSSVVEHCLPWHPDEKLLTFRAGWPTLSAVWQELRPVADSPPYRVEGDAVCDALTRLQGGPEVTVERWHQWTLRARRRAVELIGTDAWERLFAPWLPPPRRAGAPPESNP